MKIKHFIRLVYYTVSFLFILSYVGFSQSQECRIKESLQLLWNEETKTWENAFKIIHFYEHDKRFEGEDLNIKVSVLVTSIIKMN